MADDAPPQARIATSEGSAVLQLSGAVTLAHVDGLRRDIAALPDAQTAARIDVSAVTALDTAGAWLLCTLRPGAGPADEPPQLAGATPAQAALLATVARSLPEPEKPAPRRGVGARLHETLDGAGRASVAAAVFLAELLAMLGLFLARLGTAIVRPREFRLTSLVHHCHEVGLRAVPIVALMAFLIGVVLAFQGSVQLRQFGAEVFVVDLIAVSILRELGILLTAIIVAGRTASAFTAAIGSMKMREEIDAMRTLGLDPAQVLFVPRILALLIVLPILGMVANLSGLIGGAIMSWIELGISPGMFQTRMVDEVHINHALVGLYKAPAFALIIGVVGCHAGMRVKSNAESLGQMTSAAVVTAIFAVIVADALFSVFFARLGI